MAGEVQATRFAREAQFNNNASGNVQGDTYSANDSQQLTNQYEALFGPAGRDIKVDSQRNKRHQRWHLPDSIKGYNSFLTDRIDGLITDATSSPFTRNILPYFYLENPDAKIKWNVYSFDEGMASRVPYESAARVLTQTKSSQSGYAIRQGLAIAMEHNFLASEAGRENFKHQLTQLVGSIQLTNDLDVHIALLQAQSYEKIISEKYYGTERTLQRTGKQYCDMFGIYNKIPNALDLLIEEARTKLKTWGSEPPTFLLCPSNLTLHMTMSPERTNYITNGPDGLKRLAQGPDLPSYRGLNIIHSQKFSLEAGREPRNVLRRKVRVAEYYWLPHDDTQNSECSYEFYDQSSDSFRNFTKAELMRKSGVETWVKKQWNSDEFIESMETLPNKEMTELDFRKCDMLVLRPNIEHEMLSVIIGRGGTQELGSTFWGQTELACYDDAQHGIWGMSYKYHERAIVTNERNLIRMFDVAFDGYNGGMGCDIMQWTDDGISEFRRDTESLDGPYRGKSMVVLAFPTIRIKDAFMTTQIKSKIAADNEPHENPAENNKRIDLERIMRKLSTGNPSGWKRTERFLDVAFLEYKDAFTKLKMFMNMRTADGNGDNELKEYEEGWGKLSVDGANLKHHVQYQLDGGDARDIDTPKKLVQLISREISQLYFIQDCQCENMKALFLLCILDIIVKCICDVSDFNNILSIGTTMPLKEELQKLVLGGTPQYSEARTLSMKVRASANIDCECIMKALFHSGHEDYFDWLDYFYDSNKPSMHVLGEIPNPLILPLMFSDSASQVYVDSESTIPISDTPKYELKRFLMQNMTQNIYSLNSGEDTVYQKYTEQLESMFNAQVNIQPGENIRSNTTQIPTLCYHGNMKVKCNSMLIQDIKCTGHMGNSYPGMASVREGRGVQSMTMPAQIMHVQ
jgi:hypothetical protein